MRIRTRSFDYKPLHLKRDCLQSMEWLDEDNLKSVVTIDPQSDCQGFLSTLVHHCGKSWKKYYCVLKDARLYFFVDNVTRYANGKSEFFVFFFFISNSDN